MFLFALLFLLGDLYLQSFPSLPSKAFIYLASCILIFLILLTKKYLKFNSFPLSLAFAFLSGFLWTSWYATSVLSWTLPHEWEGKPLLVTGYIYSLPNSHAYGKQFEFFTEKINTKSIQTRILLTWPKTLHSLTLKPGDKWQFLVHLKRIHGTQNPGGYDFEAYALQKGLRASGYIEGSHQNKLLAHHLLHYPLARIRCTLQETIDNVLRKARNLSWLKALTIGERGGASFKDWQVLRQTGTNHLMVVGGLHIGMMAGLAHVITEWCWRRMSFLTLLLPSQHAGATGALLMGILYSSLSGFSITTQRACIMLVVFILAFLLNRKINSWNALGLAMLIVLVLNPLTILTESFWLSFFTIALIIYGMSHRLSPKGWWWKWGRVQWVIGIGLIPLTIAFFQECSLMSFFANMIAIPWLGFFILPLCLFGCSLIIVSPNIGFFFLYVADKLLSGLWSFLYYLAKLHFSSIPYAFPSYTLFIITMIGFFILLFPGGFPGRWLGLIWIASSLFYQSDKPKKNDIWLTVLDVGQGLASVLQTKNHILIYDAGPKYANLDMGETVVAPYLRLRKVQQIDMLVISHGDNDHIGGAQSLINTFYVKQVKTSAPDMLFSSSIDYCRAGETWQWDGVRFTFLYPPSEYSLKKNRNKFKNNYSCVLLIDNGKQKILLPGDIEEYAEMDLLTRFPQELKADIILAPHHGSKTSGLKPFIQAVNPRIVIYATGYRNRYHFPHPSVQKTYDDLKVKSYNTARSGAIQFKINKILLSPELYRITHKKYWYDE